MQSQTEEVHDGERGDEDAGTRTKRSVTDSIRADRLQRCRRMRRVRFVSIASGVVPDASGWGAD